MVMGDLDGEAVLRRRDEVIHDLDDSGQLPWLEQRGVELVRGRGEFAGDRRVAVGDDFLNARRAVIVGTGTVAAVPPIEGLAEARPWGNREATTAKAVPRRLLVLGGGAAGVELAQAWNSLGSSVSLVEAADRILAAEEPFASEEVSGALREGGVDLRVGVKAVGAARGDGGQVSLQLKDGEELRGDELLVAVGRRPRTDDIGLETVGVEPGGFLEVDDQMRVKGSDWLYAIGDANGRALLTHMGKYQARICADHVLGEDVAASCDNLGPPRVVFTDPEVAAVGKTLSAAQDDGIDARAIDVPTSGTAGASFRGRNTPGTSRLVVDEGERTIVGATFVGTEIAESLHAATIAVNLAVPLDRLWHAVPAFPTRSEIWLKLLEKYGL
jgi:dihydrolipoamide dehydrogenase